MLLPEKNQKNLQQSIKRLPAERIVGAKRIPDPVRGDETQRRSQPLIRAKNNVQNGISFVEIQDGVLETVGRIVGRMAELAGMATRIH